MKYFYDSPSEPHAGSYQSRVREANVKRAFDLVRSGKCQSRSALVRAMELSATSVSGFTEELIARGLISETGQQSSRLPGRRPIGLQFNAGARQIVAFALDRSGAHCCLMDMSGNILEELRAPFAPSDGPVEERGEACARLFEDLLGRLTRFRRDRAVVIGVCIPGTFIEDQHLFSMRVSLGMTLSEESMRAFQRRVGLPVCVGNSTVWMAYAEKKLIDALMPGEFETQYLTFINLGDDIGSANIMGGDVFVGPYATAGRLGHVSIDYRGRPCPCGNTGCLVQYVNASAILADVRAACRHEGVPEPAAFEDFTEAILGLPAVASVLEEAAELLSFGLYSHVCGSGVQRFVLGGCALWLGDGFLRHLYWAVRRRSYLTSHLDVSYARAGTHSEFVGFAHHFMDKAFTVTLPFSAEG